MPVIVESTLGLEDTLQQFVVLDNTLAEAEAMVVDFVANNLDVEFEIVAHQNIVIEADFARHANIKITEVDKGTADFLVNQFGNDFGSGILHTIFFDR